MKKLVGLIFIMLLSANVFGQAGRVLCRFNEEPSFVSVDKDGAEFKQKGWNFQDYLDKQTYSFVANNKLYVLSYVDTAKVSLTMSYNSSHGDSVIRKLYVLRKDLNSWSIASDLIQTDYCKVNTQGIRSFSNTYLRRKDLRGAIVIKDGVSNGYVKELEGGHLELRILIFYATNESDVSTQDYCWKTVHLIPSGDGTYLVIDVPSKSLYATNKLNPSNSTEIKPNQEVKVNSSNNGKGFECFNNDNLSLNEVSDLRKAFLDGVNQKPYNAYEKHTFKLDFNAPYSDEERGYEPANVTDGYQRKYFINSENVCLQRRVVNNVVTEAIYFHPNGKIYNVVNIVNEQKNGWVKYVDLDNYVILDGEYRNGKLIGRWNTPVLGNFNTQDNILIQQYPGVVNQMLTLINFYSYDRDTRIFKMN